MSFQKCFQSRPIAQLPHETPATSKRKQLHNTIQKFINTICTQFSSMRSIEHIFNKCCFSFTDEFSLSRFAACVLLWFDTFTNGKIEYVCSSYSSCMHNDASTYSFMLFKSIKYVFARKKWWWNFNGITNHKSEKFWQNVYTFEIFCRGSWAPQSVVHNSCFWLMAFLAKYWNARFQYYFPI